MRTYAKTLGACVALGLVFLPEFAFAQQGPLPTYRGGHWREDNYTTRKPQRGYTGWAGVPFLDYFCDYQRTPVRRCSHGRCRVVAWNMQQYCY
jgi:hypothetical protein